VYIFPKYISRNYSFNAQQIARLEYQHRPYFSTRKRRRKIFRLFPNFDFLVSLTFAMSSTTEPANVADASTQQEKVANRNVSGRPWKAKKTATVRSQMPSSLKTRSWEARMADRTKREAVKNLERCANRKARYVPICPRPERSSSIREMKEEKEQAVA
jgi:hypothetical protein